MSLPSKEHWLSTGALNNTLLEPNGIKDFRNLIISLNDSLCELTAYPLDITGKQVHQLVNLYDTSKISSLYDTNGNLLSAAFIKSLQHLINLPPVELTIQVQYGIVLNRCNIRAFPTEESALDEMLDPTLDRFQETAVYPFEPIIILHISSDTEWLFVQTYQYVGWIKSLNVFKLTHDEFRTLFYKSDYHYVIHDNTEAVISIPYQPNRVIQIPMGARIPSLIMAGSFSLIRVEIADRNTYLSSTPVVYSRSNIIALAMACLGQPYDWGGKTEYRDCSSLVSDIYRCFGIILPRNANQQAALKGIRSFPCEHLSLHEKTKHLTPGCLIFLPGHVMIYLGTFLGNHYIIHAVKEFYVKVHDSIEKSSLSGVQITPLEIYRKNWESYLTSIHTIMDILPN